MDRDLSSKERTRALLRRGALWVVGGLVLLLVVSAAIALLRPSLNADDLSIAMVDRGPVRETIEASGRVVPAFEMVLSSPVEARVQRIAKLTGDSVSSGDTILELETSELRLDRDRIDERIAQKRNEREQLEASGSQAAMESASRMEQKKLDVEILQYRRDQNDKLRAEGLIAEEEARRSAVEARKAAIELDQLERAAVSEARTSLARLEGIDLEIDILEKEREQVSRQLEVAAMKAPKDGVVTWVLPQEGATVRRGEVLARVADLSRFRIEATVSDIHATRISAGMDAIVVAGGPQSRGVVAGVDPTVRDGAVTFQIDLPDGELQLRNNLRVDVYVIVAEQLDALRLPRGSGISERNRQDLWVVRDDRAVRKPVEIGLVGYDFVEILGGLTEGDRVVISSMEDLQHADEIQIKGEEE